MISDTLSEAIDQIRRYQRDLPDCYDSIRAEIDAVVAPMEQLLRKLDTPPPIPAPSIRNGIEPPQLTEAALSEAAVFVEIAAKWLPGLTARTV